MAKKASKAVKEYYIVNPSGAIHSATYEHARDRLRDPRYRSATKEEVAKYKASKSQVWDDPICKPWQSELEAFEEPEAIGDTNE